MQKKLIRKIIEKRYTLVTEITRKIERLKGEMELVLKKIQAIDEKLNEE